ncbi:MAG: hypothetical protein Q9173_003654 [Seirophora scorigena]
MEGLYDAVAQHGSAASSLLYDSNAWVAGKPVLSPLRIVASSRLGASTIGLKLWRNVATHPVIGRLENLETKVNAMLTGRTFAVMTSDPSKIGMLSVIPVAPLLVSLLLLYVLPRTWRYLARQRLAREHGCLPAPGPRLRDPIFGLDFVLEVIQALRKNRRNTTMKSLFEAYGHSFQVKSWGRTTLFTVEPKNLQSVLATNFSAWGVQPLRLFAFEPFVGKGIMCSDGAFWEHSRALIKPTFARTQIGDLRLPAFDAHVDRLIALIPANGVTVDLQPLFARLALDASTEFLFGESVGSLHPDRVLGDKKDFLDAYNYGQMIVGRRFQLPHWNILTRDRKFWSSCETAHAFVEQYITKGISELKSSQVKGSSDEKSILLHELLRQTKDVKDVRNQLMNIFMPAHEATGVALTNVFFQLARHPTVYARLRSEIIDAGDKHEAWTFERLKGLRYLQHVISETFRLNPSIGTTIRVALRDTILPTGGGSDGVKAPLYVNRGDVVTVSLYALHRRRDIFGDDADDFRPERWETLRPPAWSYVPFSGGPRVCPGQNLALTEVAYTTVKILQTFEAMENRDPVGEFVEVYKLSTESKNGAKSACASLHLQRARAGSRDALLELSSNSAYKDKHNEANQ